MIPIEILKRVTVVYTHAHCPDGLASAMILRDAFRMLGTSPRIEFLAHGTPKHYGAGYLDEEKHGAISLFCDISPIAALVPFLLRERETIVLDHHKGAEEIVRSFGELGVFADEKLEPGVSGAVLAFRFVWLSAYENAGLSHPSHTTFEAVEDFALCVGARDTWQTKDSRFERGQWISKMLMSKPVARWLDVKFVHANGYRGSHFPYLSESEVTQGRALFEAHEEAVRQAVEQCVHTFVEGYGLFVFQEQASGFRLCSDVAESIRGDQTKPLAPNTGRVVAGFSYVVDKPGAEPRLLYSLRGLNGFDVAAFAKANGGGGHTAAAGFSVDRERFRQQGALTPYDYIQEVLGVFLVIANRTGA